VVVGFHPNSNPIASHIVLFPITRGGEKRVQRRRQREGRI
jgi:hypothetical protein